ncbi:MAG: hypothetical protein A2846_02425 [Candidatus Doudnabacteria bacterium RIFCSPHIGHO2_01_FULL_49_9]|uniref:Dockerin domain-containing protein n=1 Tax=Candidatus Doudnabacteria bacterium RIFCSPHIGHO2_01_FULL_49_9 TaxID=1817827 RepID=A0A1F5P060_9BACT|nr:MAG: hypothetical protein A2846_02425 [Candidatus Doudnabacteria bacterium RIFCSPHIGHO2_01_FULL_49_9]
MTVSTRLGYTLTRKDQFGNLVTSGSTTAYLYTNSTSPTAAFYDNGTAGIQITSVIIPNGASLANFWYFDDITGNWTITVSDNSSAPDGNTGTDDATDQTTVTLIPVTATKFIILDPADDEAGDIVQVTIRAVDAGNALDTTYNNSVTLNASGSATGSGVITIQNGIGLANITDQVAETVNLSLTDSNSTGLGVSSTQDLIFSPGPVAKFTISSPADAPAGTRLPYTVTRKDHFGNLVTTGTTTVYFYTDSTGGLSSFYGSASGGSAVTSITITNSQSSADFWYEEGKAGNWTVTASDNSSAPDGNTGTDDAADQVVISPGAVSTFVISDPGNMTSGTRLGYTVTRKDQFGNEVSSGTTTVNLYSTSTGVNKAFFAASTGGVAITNIAISGGSLTNFWYFDDTAGTWTITVSDNSGAPDGAAGIADGTDQVTVSSAAIVATKLVIQNVSGVTVGTAVTVTVRAEDNSGNLDTTFNGDVTLNVSGSATGSGIIHIVNGVGSASVNDSTPETVNLTLSDTASTSLNVSSNQALTFSAAVSTGGGGGGSGGGGEPTAPSTPAFSVGFNGTAFPGSRINVTGYSANNLAQGVVLDQANVGGAGTFNIGLNDAKLKSDFYVLNVVDKNDVYGQYKIFINLPDVNTLDNLIFAPTISLLRTAVRRGDLLVVRGYANVGSTIEAELDGVVLSQKTTVSNSDGSYALTYNTASLSLAKHFIKVRQVTTAGRTSEFSLTKSFTTSDIFRPENTDLNDDGAVDIRDVNIFLSSWVSSNPDIRLKDDFNDDGKVDIQDLSIFTQSLKR